MLEDWKLFYYRKLWETVGYILYVENSITHCDEREYKALRITREVHDAHCESTLPDIVEMTRPN